MNSTKKPLLRLAAGVGTIALAAMGVLGTASMASADVGPGQPNAPTEGSLIIHKYAGSTTSQPADGTEQTINRPPVAGVTFEVTPVGKMVGPNCVALDLGTSAGWTDAALATAKPPVAPYCLVTADTMTGDTDATGVLTFADLPLGLYYVDETAAPAGITPAVDFLVTIPYANQSGSTVDWLYDVHVYPKNDIEGDGSKTVGDATGHGLGSTVPWTITSKPLGSFNSGAPLTAFSLIDNLDSRLTYAATPAATFTYTTPGNAPVAVGAANGTITPPPAGPGGTVTAALTPAGVTWANTLPAGTQFTLSFSTTVTGVGDINNEAFQNSGGDNVTLGEASTQWGPATVLKHQAGDTTKTLAGAKFSVYDSVGGVCTGTLGAAISINGQTEFTSAANGVVTIAGLFVGNNNTVATRLYCVVETVAPVGFVLDSTPKAITVKAEATATTTAHIDVANRANPGPTLPLTGGDGALWFTIGGIALLVVAAGGLMMVRRNRH